MSWIPAPEAHVEAGVVGPGAGRVDHDGLAAAVRRGASSSDFHEFLSSFDLVGQPAKAEICDQHVEAAVGLRLDGDGEGVRAVGDLLDGPVAVLERHAAGEQGSGNHNDAAHVLGSNDGWITAYIGIPFLEKGRTRAGLDCWGLIRLVWLERLGVALPLWCEGYAATDPCDETAGHLAGCARAFAEIPAGQERPGDILLFRTGQLLSHVGLCIGRGEMLHILEGIDSCTQNYRSPMWARRLMGVYRV
jgi:hypothetical protein